MRRTETRDEERIVCNSEDASMRHCNNFVSRGLSRVNARQCLIFETLIHRQWRNRHNNSCVTNSRRLQCANLFEIRRNLHCVRDLTGREHKRKIYPTPPTTFVKLENSACMRSETTSYRKRAMQSEDSVRNLWHQRLATTL